MTSPVFSVLMSSFAACASFWRDDARQLLIVDEQRLRRLLHLHGALVGGNLLRREAVVQLLHGPGNRLADRSLAAGRYGLQPDLDRLGAPLVGEPRKRRNGLDFDLALGPLQHGQQVLDALLVAELADAADHRRQGFHFAAQHFDEAGQGFGAADFRKRIDGALAHPPVRILGGLDQLSDGTLVLGLVENLNGRAADVLVLVLDQRENGVDDARSPDLAERIGRPGPHPPIAVCNDLQQVLDRLGGSDHVQYLDRSAAGVLVLILEHIDQVLDRFRMIGMHHEIDGFVLHVDLRIAQHAADQRHVERAVHAGQRRDRRGADQFVVVLELLLHRFLDLGHVEACEHLDDMQPRQRVLALDSRDQVVDRGFLGDFTDDFEEPGALGGLLGIRRIEQVAHREAGLLSGDHVENRLFRHAFLAERVEECARRIVAARG